ncbi:MAG: cytochrome c-type biogenesis protein CcmH [bacterium]
MRNIIINLVGISLISFVILAWSGALYSDETDIEKQQALQAELEHSLVAPCCWNMTVDQHESSASHEVRDKISTLIKQGKTKNEILQAMVAQYGERILASPSQNTILGKLAYWLIPLAIVLGIIVVGKTINRLSNTKTKKPVKQVSPLNQKDKSSYWDKRIEEELKKFE